MQRQHTQAHYEILGNYRETQKIEPSATCRPENISSLVFLSHWYFMYIFTALLRYNLHIIHSFKEYNSMVFGILHY